VVNVATDTTTGKVLSASPSFTASTYATVPASLALEGVDTSTSGFLMYVKQSETGRDNNTQARLDHLADNSENLADDWGSEGYSWTVEIVNFDQDGNPQGEFRDSGNGDSMDVPYDFIPGIPGLEGGTDNMAAEILAFIEFPEAGYYTMIFNSDDGFLVSETHGADDSRGATLGVFEGGRGASDTTFGFAVAEAGVYPIRAIWYEGGGGANLEWSSIVDGERVLINDTSAGGLKAFRSRSGTPTNVDTGGGDGSISSVALTDGSVVIEYTGTLKSATSVTGPYSDVAGASSPYSVAPTKAAEFYIAE